MTQATLNKVGPSTWEIDPTHTSVAFAIRHLMIATVRGRFLDVKGTVTGDVADPRNSKVKAEIATATIDTGEKARDTHLRSADFFDAENYPTISFESRRIENKGDGELKIVGDLTIRGTTREVVLDATLEGTGNDPWGGTRSAFSATTKIKRSEFGLKWNQLLETGGVTVGDEVKITIDVELVKKAEIEEESLAVA